jgi:hypothetical protein
VNTYPERKLRVNMNMLIESIFLAILVFSTGGLLLILLRKAPLLSSLSQNGTTGIKKHRFVLSLENKIKETLVYFEKQIFLHKLLSWTKVMILKIETQIDILLHKIRRRAQEGKK